MWPGSQRLPKSDRQRARHPETAARISANCKRVFIRVTTWRKNCCAKARRRTRRSSPGIDERGRGSDATLEEARGAKRRQGRCWARSSAWQALSSLSQRTHQYSVTKHLDAFKKLERKRVSYSSQRLRLHPASSIPKVQSWLGRGLANHTDSSAAVIWRQDTCGRWVCAGRLRS